MRRPCRKKRRINDAPFICHPGSVDTARRRESHLRMSTFQLAVQFVQRIEIGLG